MNLRTAVLGVAALAAGYLVGRRVLRMRGASTDSLRERAGEALPGNGVEVPIGGTGEDEADEAEVGAGEETGADGDDEPAPGADPSLEEIDERTASDVEEEPAEPGEMQVDEDVVDEAVDEDETEE